jgi:flagellar motor switch protein FliM
METALQAPHPVVDQSFEPGAPLVPHRPDEEPVAALSGPLATEEGIEKSVSLARTATRSKALSTEQSTAELPEYLQQIRFRLELRIPLPSFTLRHLNALVPGTVLQTEHSSTRDLVLCAAKERLLSVELEAVEMQLAARVKRLL